MRQTIQLTICFAGIAFAAAAAQAENWDRFRGPNGAGQGQAAAIPNEWTAADFLWKKSLPGVGHSSPVVWGDRLFVTSADPESAEQIVLAYDANTGDEIWQQRYPSTPYSMHRQNSYATSTPAVDADRVYVLWSDGGHVTLAALTHDGTKIWRQPVGSLEEKHGFGTSPVLIDGVVCVANETTSAKNCAVMGFDTRTGKEIWRMPRAAGNTVFATPCVWQSPAGKKLLLSVGTGTGLTAFDPADGHIAWQGFEQDLSERCVSSPIVAGDLAFISTGSGNNGRLLIAVRPSEDGAPEEAYRLRQGVPNVPTPIVVDDLLFLWHDRGTVSCVEATTSRPYWRQRVGGTFHSSPVRIGDRILCTSLDGEVVVLAADREFRLLARNSLDEPVQATPAVADGRIYFRTDSSIICLGER